MAKEISKLREKGILIIGSGNIVHNLRKLAWNKLNDIYAYDWTQEVNTKVNEYILNGNHEKLIDYSKLGNAFKLAIPTPEHYLPMLYILALQHKNEKVILFNDKPIGGSLTMTSLLVI